MCGDRAVIIIAIFCLSVANADFNGSLPSIITLPSNTSQTHNAIMDCSSYWECVFGDYSHNFTYSTNGNADSTLTLNATLPPNHKSQNQNKPFFIGTMTINPHSTLNLQGFESFNLGNSLNINGGRLSFANGDFATLFDTNISVINGGQIGIVGNGFTNRGNMSAQNATISITANSARNYGSIINNNGNISIQNTNLYNIGQKVALATGSPSSVASIVNNGGTITIGGNVYNGGQENMSRLCQIGGCGGGNLTNNGGSITIQGQLISEPKDGQSSSINIYGGTLEATNGVQNNAGSTLIIGALDGKMGQIQGGVNNQGSFIVDALGANAGNYTLITGIFTGNAPKLQNSNGDFTSANLSADNKTLEIKTNQAKIDNFKATLSTNEMATLSTFGDEIYGSGVSKNPLKQTINNINHSIFNTFHFMPLAISDTISENVNNTIYTNQSNISANIMLDSILGNNTNGILSGINTNIGLNLSMLKIYYNLAYAYASMNSAIKDDIAIHKTRTTSHNFSLSQKIILQPIKNFNIDLGLSGIVAITNFKRDITLNAISLTPKSQQNIYKIVLDLALSYKFLFGNFAIMPYFGLNQGYIAMPSFNENNGKNFTLIAKSYKTYFLDVPLGARMSFHFGDYGAILSDIKYTILAYKTQNERIFYYTNKQELRFNIPSAHKISVNLGYFKDFNKWYLHIYGHFGAIFNENKAIETNAKLISYGIDAKCGYQW